MRRAEVVRDADRGTVLVLLEAGQAVVGQALHLCHGVAIGGKWAFLLALQWFDKNVVTMLSNKHGDTMKPYEYKAKGEVDKQESEQPETREE